MNRPPKDNPGGRPPQQAKASAAAQRSTRDHLQSKEGGVEVAPPGAPPPMPAGYPAPYGYPQRAPQEHQPSAQSGKYQQPYVPPANYLPHPAHSQPQQHPLGASSAYAPPPSQNTRDAHIPPSHPPPTAPPTAPSNGFLIDASGLGAQYAVSAPGSQYTPDNEGTKKSHPDILQPQSSQYPQYLHQQLHAAPPAHQLYNQQSLHPHPPLHPQQTMQQQYYTQQPPVCSQPGAPRIELDASGLPAVSGHLILQEAKFKVEEGALKRDSFVIKNSTGSVIFNVIGSNDYNKTKTMKDVHGTPLLALNEQRGSRKKERITIHYPTSSPILTLHKTSAAGGQKVVKGYLGPGETDCALTITNTKNLAFGFFVRGQLIANASRKKTSLKKVFTAQDSYEICISIGSPALLCMLVVALDEFYSD